MDQVKAFLAALKKHHFWVLGGLVLILGLSGWYVAANDLATQYKTNRDKIESEFKELQAITSRTEHPNQTFEDGTFRLVSNLKQDVQTAWAKIYNHQKTSVLAWPEELGPEFLEWIELNPPDAVIPQDLRERYLNHVKEEFPRLLAMVDARPFWDQQEEATGNRPGRGGAIGGLGGGGQNRARPVEPGRDYKVIWDEKNQKLIDEQLDFIGVPSTQEVRYCQENLWVYHALLKAIAQVNEGATGHHNAKIKEIIALAVAQDASDIIGELTGNSRIILPEGVNPSGLAPGAIPGLDAEGAPMEAAAEEMSEEVTQDRMGIARKRRLDEKRYVDEKGSPMRSAETNPPQFKRLPVVLRLRMDQREIANLLVTLANSPLPVDIRQLRINTKMQGSAASSRPMMFGGGGDGGSTRGRKQSGMAQRDKTLEEALLNPYELNVELIGTIYIFNPPDKKAFELDDNAAAAAEEDAAADAIEQPTEETPAPAEQDSRPQDTDAEESLDAPADDTNLLDESADDLPAEETESEAAPPRRRGPAPGEPTDEAGDEAEGFESADTPAEDAPPSDPAPRDPPEAAAEEEEVPF